MTGITKLPAELRRIAEEICEEGHNGWPNDLNDIATQLEAALPTWIKVTDVKDLPEGDEYMWAWQYDTVAGDWSYSLLCTPLIEFMVTIKEAVYYRELGPMDRPQEGVL